MIWRYINLEHHQDRNESMLLFFRKNKIRNKRINAITPKEIKNFTDKEFKNEFPICCLLSHLVAIKDFYDSGEKIGIICEDDLDDVFFHKFNLNKILNYAPEDWEILQLAYSLDSISGKFYKKNKYLDWKKNIYCTMCYAINRKGAEKLLNKVFLNNQLSNFKFPKMVADLVLYQSVKTYTYYLSLFFTKLLFKSSLGNDLDKLIKYNKNCLKIYDYHGLIN